MATIVNCPRTDCARNRAGQCDMARLDLAAWIVPKNGVHAGLYLLCRAFEPKGAA